MAQSFTPRQGEFLAFIHRFTERRGMAPSFGEMAAHFGVTTPSVNGMIKTLERNGLISRVPGAARTLRVEVPISALPEIAFGRSGSRRRAGRTVSTTSSAPPVLADAASAAAIAVLDAMMPPLLKRRAAADEVNAAVIDAARAVGAALVATGVVAEQSEGVALRVLAEASRWQPNGRGSTPRRRIWVRD